MTYRISNSKITKRDRYPLSIVEIKYVYNPKKISAWGIHFHGEVYLVLSEDGSNDIVRV